MKRLPYILVVFILIYPVIGAQESSPGQRVASYLESLASYGEGAMMVSDLADEIDALSENPVSINEASELELSRIFFLTVFQVKNLAEYIRTKGKIISVAEISYIPGFDRKLAELMAPFIVIEDSKRAINNRSTWGRLLFNLVTRSTYRDSISMGSPVKMLLRSNIKSGNTSIGLTVEKDQGEIIFDSGYGPDFLSGYISTRNGGFIKNFILGDMKVRFGQGLVAWTGYSAGTTALDPALMKSMASITPYSSSDENNFFRGAAITAGTDRDRLLAYISCNSIDATTTVPPDNRRRVIKSFYDQGLHNTPSTIAKKDVVTEYSAGISYNRNSERLHTGISIAGTRFSIPVEKRDGTEDYFNYSGQSNLSISFDHAFSFRNSYFYGEGAWNPGGGFALIEGIRITPATGTAFNIMYTNVTKGYNSFHGMANGRETINNFEESLIANFSFEPARNLAVVTGIIWSHDHWYGIYGTPPGSKWRYEADTRYNPSESLSLNFGIKHRVMNDYAIEFTGLKQDIPLKYTNLRLNASFIPLERLVLQARVEFIYGKTLSEPGFLIYSGMKYGADDIRLSVFARVYVWSTRDYDSRIYAWEDDLLYTGPVLPYYFKGNRSYLVVSYKIGERIACRFKAGFSSKMNNDDELLYDNEFKLQVVLKL